MTFVPDGPDLFAAETYAHGAPYDYFRRLRDEAPVFRHPHPDWDDFWCVMRHADVQRVSRDSATFSNHPNPFIPDRGQSSGDDMSSLLLISLDPPDHTKMRKLVNKGFTPRRVADLTHKIQATVDRLIDDVAGRSGCDLVTDIAVELPLQVIADLVGVPEEDRHQVFEWTELTFGFDPTVDAEARSAAAQAMYAYADQMCETRKAEPHDDLMGVLLDAEIDGERLTQFQIDVFFMLLQNAGSETTRNLITTGTLALVEHPDQLELLRANLPELLPNAIEELLRLATPVVQFCRRPRVDTVVGDERIGAGEPVAMFYTSANRDERAFPAPDRLDITRDTTQHVAFGAGGPHFCLGASLARLEARIMFEAILTRFDGLEVTADPASLPRVHSNLIDGFASMPITWTDVRPKAAP